MTKSTRILSLLILLVLAIFTVVLLSSPIREMFFKNDTRDLSARIDAFLKSELIQEKRLRGNGNPASDGRNSVIYVLGGSQKSLILRFRTAARLYHSGVGEKILVLSTPGITEYDPSLGRNLKNDEWVIKILHEDKVPSSDVVFIRLPKGILGTLREANQVSGLSIDRGFRRLILVTSAYHTRRASLAFRSFADHQPLEIYVYGAAEEVSLMELIREYLKLEVYRSVLIPAESLWRHFHRPPTT